MKGCHKWVPIHFESEPGALAPVYCFSVGFCALLLYVLKSGCQINVVFVYDMYQLAGG